MKYCAADLLLRSLLPDLKYRAAKLFNVTPFSLNRRGLRPETISLKKNPYCFSGKTVVCIGDSNTFGWNYKYLFSYPVLLENKLRESYEYFKVINCGIGGNTAADAVKRIKDDVLFFKPEIVVLNFGLNDGRLIKMNGNNNFKKKSNLIYMAGNYFDLPVCMEEFKCCMENIILKLSKNYIKIILMGLYETKNLKLSLNSGEGKRMIDLQNKVYGGYNDIIKNLALKNNIEFFDLWNKLRNYEKIKNCLQIDGIHLNLEGYELVVDNLKRIISGAHR